MADKVMRSRLSERSGCKGYCRWLGSLKGGEGLDTALVAGGRNVTRFVAAIAIVHVDIGGGDDRHAKPHLGRCGCMVNRACGEDRKQQEGKDAPQPFHGMKTNADRENCP